MEEAEVPMDSTKKHRPTPAGLANLIMWKPGQSGNPSGRPKNTMKDYMRRKFMEMSDEDKEAFLKDVPRVDQIKLAEGNPHTTTDVTSDGKRVVGFNLIVPQDGDDRDNTEPKTDA
jgi:hypothetical protein